MNKQQKDADRRMVALTSFYFVLIVGSLLILASLFTKLDTSKAEVIFGTIIAYIITIGIANYFSSPSEDKENV